MKFEEFKDRFHISLNEQQMAAVRSVDKPTLLLAVPGSGKTTVLVTRLGYMIYCLGIAPEKILTVTYTVAATKDMRQRFAESFGSEMANRIEFRTINGICAKIISYFGNRLNKKAFELVTDEGAKTQLLSSIYVKQKGSYPTENDLKTISTLITYTKNMMLKKEEIKKLGDEQDVPLAEIFDEYGRQMREHSLMDYDDQMVYALTMLKSYPQVLEYFQTIYGYICVDEAQDTSKIQHEIIGLLARMNQNIFMVGDEDQSIYGFRAAYPDALLDFEKNYPTANVLLMEENFRSTATIVGAADRFIQKNELRHKKRMITRKEPGADIQNIQLTTRRKQYEYLVEAAKNCNEETAVLFRDNESIIPVIDLLERQGIPYRYRNSDLTFFSHRVVLDIINIISFAADPYNTDLFMKIYYKIGTYLNKTAAMAACRDCETGDITVLDAALLYGNLQPNTKKSVKSIQTHMKAVMEESASKAVYRIINLMGYSDYLDRCQIKDSKLQIIQSLAVNEESALSLIDRMAELAKIIREKEFDFNCKFILSTIHSSKGLEYEHVYLLDVKDGVFPEKVVRNRKRASSEEIKTYEEERRLFYVGATRAKNILSIFSFAGDSTFCDELLGIKREVKLPSQVPVKKTKYDPRNVYLRYTK